MTIPLELIESDVWPSIRHKIQEKRAECIEGLLHIAPEGLRGEQKFIAALDWVIEQSMPQKPASERGIYDDDDD